MALTFPRDPVIELYLNGWTDITASVRQTAPITIIRGRSDEQGAISPTTCSMLIDNTSGNFNPDNPNGSYFGLIGRNTPIRYSLRVITDTFGRTVSNGWGSADTGEAYSTIGTPASDFAVASGFGTHSITGTSVYHATYLGTASYRNVEIRATFKVNVSNVTGGAIEPANLLLRGQSTSDYYMLRLTIETNESFKIGIRHADDSVIATAVTVSGLTHSSTSTLYTVAFQAEGETLRGKIWLTSGAEPSGWHVTGQSTRIASPGWVGVRSGVASGNTNTAPVIFSYDESSTRLPRFAGELSAIQPQWSVDHSDKTVAIEAAGIMRRLGQGVKNTKSPLQRFIEQNVTQPVAYWPLDDGENVLIGKSVLGAYGAEARIRFLGTQGAVADRNAGKAFGSGVLATWFKPVVNLDKYTYLRCAVTPTYQNSAWTTYLAVRFDGRYTGTEDSDAWVISNPDFNEWWIRFYSQSQEIEVTYKNIVQAYTRISTAIFDGKPHLLGFSSTQVGSDVDWSLTVDGSVVGGGTRAAITNPTVAHISFYLFNAAASSPYPRSIGHMVLYGSGPSITDLYYAYGGHSPESAGERLQRICAEESIPFAYQGTLLSTASMGPQRSESILTSLKECEAADLGTLYETRGTLGLAYRTLANLANQSARLTLDYSAQQLAPIFQPNHDDLNTRNDVTVNRQDGSRANAVATTGPLNVNDPGEGPNAVGRYDVSFTANVEADDMLQDMANWLLHLGTVDEPRFPHVSINLATSGVPSAEVLDLDVDERLTISNATALNIYDQITQIARGSTETLDTIYKHFVTFNAAPESPYHIGITDDSGTRADSDASTLASDITAAPATLSVAVSDGHLWTTDGAQFSFDVIVGGQRMTISGISGSSSPQTFTVSNASVNGVSRAWSAGTKVSLAVPTYFGLR